MHCTLHNKHENSDFQFKFKGDSEIRANENPDLTSVCMSFELPLIWSASLNFLILTHWFKFDMKCPFSSLQSNLPPLRPLFPPSILSRVVPPSFTPFQYLSCSNFSFFHYPLLLLPLIIVRHSFDVITIYDNYSETRIFIHLFLILPRCWQP